MSKNQSNNEDELQTVSIGELEAQRKKLIIDLVEFACEFKKLKPGISIHSEALANFVTLDTMADLVINTFTKPANPEEGKEDEEKASEVAD